MYQDPKTRVQAVPEAEAKIEYYQKQLDRSARPQLRVQNAQRRISQTPALLTSGKWVEIRQRQKRGTMVEGYTLDN